MEEMEEGRILPKGSRNTRKQKRTENKARCAAKAERRKKLNEKRIRGQVKEKISAVRGLAKHGDDNIDIDTVDTRRDGSTDSQTRERRCNRQIREGERDEASKARRDNTEG
jgi:hypothetical protein